LIVAVSTFVSATVDAIVAVATPPAFVGPAGRVTTFPEPVEPTCTSCPGTGLPFASRTVTVIVDVAIPSAGTFDAGLAVAVESDALIVPGSATNATAG